MHPDSQPVEPLDEEIAAEAARQRQMTRAEIMGLLNEDVETICASLLDWRVTSGVHYRDGDATISFGDGSESLADLAYRLRQQIIDKKTQMGGTAPLNVRVPNLYEQMKAVWLEAEKQSVRPPTHTSVLWWFAWRASIVEQLVVYLLVLEAKDEQVA